MFISSGPRIRASFLLLPSLPPSHHSLSPSLSVKGLNEMSWGAQRLQSFCLLQESQKLSSLDALLQARPKKSPFHCLSYSPDTTTSPKARDTARSNSEAASARRKFTSHESSVIK